MSFGFLIVVGVLVQVEEGYRIVLVYFVASSYSVAQFVATFPFVHTGIQFNRYEGVYLAVGNVVLYIQSRTDCVSLYSFSVS